MLNWVLGPIPLTSTPRQIVNVVNQGSIGYLIEVTDTATVGTNIELRQELAVIANETQTIVVSAEVLQGAFVLQAVEEVNGNERLLASTNLLPGGSGDDGASVAQNFTLTITPQTSTISLRLSAPQNLGNVGTNVTALGSTLVTTRPTNVILWQKIRVKVNYLEQEQFTVTLCDSIEDKYRFGFNGQEKVNEIAGIGNYVDLGERGVDTRIARLNWRPDPRTVEYPWQSPYASYHRNSPIVLADYLGGGDPPNFGNISTVKNVAQNSNWADYTDFHFEPGRLFRGKSPVFNNCWHSARDQINNVNSSYKPQLDNQRVNMYQHKDQSKTGTQTAVNLQKGVDIIVRNLEQGLPVMVGVMYNENKNTGNSNRATNHYINVVGMGTDENGVYFSYYDNYGGKEKGTNLTKNRFYYDEDREVFYDNTNPPIGDGQEYIMTEVRDNQKEPEFDKQKLDDMRLNEGMKTPGNW